MEIEKLFSIIVPVYNVQEYLVKCVTSVLEQSFYDFEIILVDDGSTDRSIQICDEFHSKDVRVRVIHQKNGGASAARNAGIRDAKGRYLLFLDSDDFWDDKGALQRIYSVLCTRNYDADVAIFQAKLLYPDGTIIPDTGVFDVTFNDMSPIESLTYMSENGTLVGSACSKVIRRDFLIDNGLFFKEGVKHEDIDWILRMANCLPKYIYLDEKFYIYRKGRAESVTSNVNYNFLSGFAEMLDGFRNYAYHDEIVRECLLSYVAYEFCILMAQTYNLRNQPERKEIIAKLLDMKDVLKHDMNPKVKKINALSKIFGFRATMLVLGMYLRYRKR